MSKYNDEFLELSKKHIFEKDGVTFIFDNKSVLDSLTEKYSETIKKDGKTFALTKNSITVMTAPKS